MAGGLGRKTLKGIETKSLLNLPPSAGG